MRYAFILGRHPSLSVAELTRAVPGISIDSVTDGVCVADCPALPDGFLNMLGGTIKIAEVTASFGALTEINAEVLRTYLPPRDGRMIFGLSIYGHVSGPERRALYIEGLALKKLLKEEGRRARYVVSQEKQLSSVVVSKNKLIEEGAEFIIIKEGKRVLLARTIAIQEFEAYGERDFDRPGRSAKRGMLPPKLAQMLVNVAHGDKNLPLLDPFCGSGTVLGEALLMGFTQVIGADISEDAVTDSTAYLNWLEASHPEFRGRWKVILTDARELEKHLAPGSIGCIAAEPYLGPPQSGVETTTLLAKRMETELVPLYTQSIAILSKLLAPNGSAVFTFPIFGKGKQPISVPIKEVAGDLTIEPLIPAAAAAAFNLPLTLAGGARYERPDQHVAREVVLLSKH